VVNDTRLPLASVRIASTSGSVRVTTVADLDQVSVVGAATVIDGDAMTVDGGSRRTEVRVPVGMDLVIGTASGRVEVFGSAGAVAVVTKSGRVLVEDSTSLDVRTSSGAVAGECRIVGRSGRVDVGRCGTAHVTTTSGRITLRGVHGPAHAHCVSGRIDLTMAAPGDVDAETVSGRITVAMPAGSRVRIETPKSAAVAAAAVVDSDGECDCVVTARSGSGRVVVT
jgi:hypothetical protein